MYLKTNQYHMKEFTYPMSRLKSIDEGGQSIPDSSMLMLMLMLIPNLYDGENKGDDNRRACGFSKRLADI